jgi:hypothetical protein
MLLLKADKQWNATGTTLTTSDDEGVIRIYKRKSAVRTVFYELINSYICQILEIVWKDDGRRARRVEWSLNSIVPMHFIEWVQQSARAVMQLMLVERAGGCQLTVRVFRISTDSARTPLNLSNNFLIP